MEEMLFRKNIRRICQNDKEGLRQIYEDYCPMIYSVVWEILQNKEDAEDITSEFFIRLWEIADTYYLGKGHRRWMITIAHNMAIDYLRKKRREVPTEDMQEPVDFRQVSCEEQLCHRISLEQAMTALKQEERQVVNLKIMGELTFREIAEILKKPQGTVAWCYQKAIRKLREARL